MSRKKIQDLIAQGKTKQALEMAKAFYQNDQETLTKINLLMSRFKTNSDGNSMGILSTGDYNQENNKIVFALLNITTHQAPTPDPVAPDPVQPDPVVRKPVSPDPVPVAPPPGALKIIELFLASSSELKEDRNAVEIWINRENNKLVTKGVFLKLNLWENFLDAMSNTRLQSEYNKAVVNSDIFISLYKTKVGKYTEEEFDAAYQSFKTGGKPKYVYTFFKDFQLNSAEIDLSHLTSLENFKNKLKQLGHFRTPYKNTEDLLRRLDNQMDIILEKEGLI